MNPLSASEKWRFRLLLVLLLLCALGGGSSRSEVLSLLYLRPLSVVCAAIILMLPGPLEFRAYKPLFFGLGALTLVIAAQLVPLPPGLWAELPRRELDAAIASAVGAEAFWRPVSLTPDLTWNSLVAVLPPLAALIGFAAINSRQRRHLVVWFIGLICFSAFWGIVQVAGGSRSFAQLYQVAHDTVPAGLLANRNHQAVFLAAAFPLLRAWTLLPELRPANPVAKNWFAAAICLFMVPVILATGSRSGMALGLLSLLFTYFMAPWKFEGRGFPGVKWLILLIPIGVAGALIAMDRALSVKRLYLVTELVAEKRIANIPLMIEMIRDYLPFGSGFGSFAPLFRRYEYDSSLAPTYFNNAHNDLIEVALTGGLPALALLLAGLIWWGRTAVRVVRSPDHRSGAGSLKRAGAIVTSLLLLASLTDYPLRTPFLAVFFVIACGWMASSNSRMAKVDSR